MQLQPLLLGGRVAVAQAVQHQQAILEQQEPSTQVVVVVLETITV
jgi:hypothetical protein